MQKLLLSALVLCATGSTAFATVSFSSKSYGLNAPDHTNIIIDFENKMPTGFSLTGGRVRNVTDDVGAEPAGDASYYLAANPDDPAMLLSTSGFRTISLYWGSMDDYNSITLLDKNGKSIKSFTGLQISSPANGDRADKSTNRRVTFTTSGMTSPIYGLDFQSSTPAFEVDNIAFMTPGGEVPEPTTWTMMMGGLGLLGVSLRRSKKTGALAVLRA